MAVADDRSAALLLRVWIEESDQFRARLMAVGSDDQVSDRTVALASTPVELLDAVGAWLDEFLRYGAAPG